MTAAASARHAGIHDVPAAAQHPQPRLRRDGIYYLALYPDEETTIFNEGFFRFSDNALPRISPRDAAFERVVRVIPVPDAAPGRLLHLAMDGEAGEALCWLE